MLLKAIYSGAMLRADHKRCVVFFFLLLLLCIHLFVLTNGQNP